VLIMEAEEVVTRKLAEKEGVDPELAEAITRLAEKDDRFRKALASVGLLGEQLKSFPEAMQQQIGQPLSGLLFYGLSKDMLKDDDTEFLEKISKMKLAVEMLKDDGKGKEDGQSDIYKLLYEQLKKDLEDMRKEREETLKKVEELKEELRKKEYEEREEELLSRIDALQNYIQQLEDRIRDYERVLREPREDEEKKPKSTIEQVKEFKQQIESLAEALELLGYKVHKGEEMDIDSLINKLKRMGFEVKAPQMTLQELQKKLEEEREKAKKEAYQEAQMIQNLLDTILGHVKPVIEKGIESFSKAWSEVKKEETKAKLMLMAQQVVAQRQQTPQQPQQPQSGEGVKVEVKENDRPVEGEEGGISSSNEESGQHSSEGD